MAVEAGGIGARLRAGREKLGLTVLQTSERLHTDPRIVDAIEAEDFETLGAPVYARGHIRHYAELVGESVLELNALYSNLSRVEQPDLTKIAKAPPSGESSKLVAPALLVIAVFAVAGAVWWVSALSKKKPPLAETHIVGDATSGMPSELADAQGIPNGASAPAAPEPSSSTRSSAPTMQGSGTGAARDGRPQAAGSATNAPGAGSTLEQSASAIGAGAAGTRAKPYAPEAGASGPTSSGTAAGSSATETTTTPTKRDAQVTLHFAADSWAEVYDASGARLFYDVGAANTVKTFSGAPPLRVVLGNASGVTVDFNGHSTSIAKLLQPDGSAQFSITRSGHVVGTRPVTDGG